jgi:simple sugar transport system permease protein
MSAPFRLARRLEIEPRRSTTYRIYGAVGGLLFSGLLLLITGRNPFKLFWDSLHSIFGSQRGIEGVLVQSVPILMCALGVALSLRMKVWNIGSDGQFLMGAFAALGFGINLHVPHWLLLIIMAAAAMAAGAIWILVPALARAYWGVNEIITTLLLNFVGLQLVIWSSLGFWRDRKAAVTQSTRSVPTLLPRFPGLHQASISIIVPLVLAAVLWFVFRGTRSGYEIDIIGGNPNAAAFAGVNVKRRVVVVMLLTGALAGLGGMLQLTGAPGAQALSGGFSARYGLSGFIVAALAGASFPGVIVAGLFISSMFYAGIDLQTRGLSVYIIFGVYGVVLVGIALGETLSRFRLLRQPATSTAASTSGVSA